MAVHIHRRGVGGLALDIRIPRQRPGVILDKPIGFEGVAGGAQVLPLGIPAGLHLLAIADVVESAKACGCRGDLPLYRWP